MTARQAKLKPSVEVPEIESTKSLAPPPKAENRINEIGIEEKKNSEPVMDKKALIELARRAGLEFVDKRVFIKHSYSITVDNRDKFKSYCTVLGKKMQDELHEMMEKYFQDNRAEYEAKLKISATFSEK